MGQELLQIGLVTAVAVIVLSLVLLRLGFKNIRDNITKLKTRSKDKTVLIINLKYGAAILFCFIVTSILSNGLEKPVTPIASMLHFQIHEVNPLLLLVGLIALVMSSFSSNEGNYNRKIFGDIGFLMTNCYFYMSVGFTYIAMYFKY